MVKNEDLTDLSVNFTEQEQLHFYLPHVFLLQILDYSNRTHSQLTFFWIWINSGTLETSYCTSNKYNMAPGTLE